MRQAMKLGNGEVPLSRPKRRRFSAGYKLRILAEVDACSLPGQIAGLLRREGLYSSHLTGWRQQRETGALSALSPVKPGPKARRCDPHEARNKELEKENRTLKRRLKRAEWLLEISKKGAELMEKMALGRQFETEDSE
ncbi:MAG: transposase [Candidatus Dormibacteraceae bacterium]